MAISEELAIISYATFVYLRKKLPRDTLSKIHRNMTDMRLRRHLLSLIAVLMAFIPRASLAVPADSLSGISGVNRQEARPEPTFAETPNLANDASRTDAARTQALQNLMQLGIDAYNAGKIDQAESHWLATLTRAESEANAPMQVKVLWRLATLERRRANFYAALSFQLRVLNLIRARPELGKIWKVQSEIAVLFEQLELFDQARSNNKEAVESAKQAGTPLDIAVTQIQYAGFLNDFGTLDSESTRLLIEAALPVLRVEGTQVQLASATLQAGRNQLNLANFAQAQSYFDSALLLATNAPSQALVAHIQLRQGELALLQENPKAALEKVSLAKLGYEAQRNRPRLIKTYAMLERIYGALGDELAAARAGREHYRLRDEVLGGKISLRFEQRLNALILSEERASNDALKALNTAASLRLRYQQRLFFVVAGGAIILSLLFYGLLRRHRAVQKLNRDLTQAHDKLKTISAELYHASITDALTGVFNRRYGISTLDAMLLNRDGRPLSVSMIDLDHFKKINDQYGHPVGDEVLRSVTRSILATMPRDAILARVGGEEFLLLIPGCGPYESALLLRQAGQNVAQQTIWTPKGPLNASMSIGERIVSTDEQTPAAQILTDADFALYAAKQRGRGVVVRWGEFAHS